MSKDIWLQIDQNKCLNDILEVLMEEYQVDYETLYNDVKSYINELVEEGLVTHNG
ncbi:PqqD family protein [Clostridium sp. MSJ-4]|uniref:PqqD family protein n=1 Tax=Clostridium simiarum TaxID=2841506 RepID=A0ABS6F019_9CLOT|nr:PqqD family protein [Clostridium simiarum]